jgi:hypothetical protein
VRLSPLEKGHNSFETAPIEHKKFTNMFKSVSQPTATAPMKETPEAGRESSNSNNYGFRALPRLSILRLFAFVQQEVFLQEPISTCFSFLLDWKTDNLPAENADETHYSNSQYELELQEKVLLGPSQL